MFINPKVAIENGWIKFPEWMTEEQKAECLQPNAIDITMDAVFGFDHSSYFILTDDTKVMRKQNKIVAQDLPNHGLVYPISGVVDVLSDFYVNIPAGYAGYLIVRSTFNRNGLFVTSGMFDQGFAGSVGFALHNRGQVAYIAPHTRIAQFVFVKSEDSGELYSGGYNTKQSQHWTDAVEEKTTSVSIDEPLVDTEETITNIPEKEPTVALKDIAKSTTKPKKESK